MYSKHCLEHCMFYRGFWLYNAIKPFCHGRRLRMSGPIMILEGHQNPWNLPFQTWYRWLAGHCRFTAWFPLSRAVLPARCSRAVLWRELEWVVSILSLAYISRPAVHGHAPPHVLFSPDIRLFVHLSIPNFLGRWMSPADSELSFACASRVGDFLYSNWRQIPFTTSQITMNFWVQNWHWNGTFCFSSVDLIIVVTLFRCLPRSPSPFKRRSSKNLKCHHRNCV